MMNGTVEAQSSTAMLRLKVATNYFKRMLLGDLHIAGKAQTSTVFKALAKKLEENVLSDRTWSSWFSNTLKIPKREKIKVLDTLAALSLRVNKINGLVKSEDALPAGTFSEMVHGGLVNHMMAPTKSKNPLYTLAERAENYHPLSALHLHLDAIEIGALSDGFADVPWTTVKAIGAQRILTILAGRWGPRYGSVYSELSSDLRLEWEAADTEKRSQLRDAYARFKPDRFNEVLNGKASPDWNRIGVNDDVSAEHIYKVLFALAADTDFLVADRLDAWFIDLATSALAMHALGWADRYNIFGFHITEEMIFWGAFDEVLFGSELPESNNRELFAAMTRCNAEWTEASFEMFLRAREMYQATLIEFGVSAHEVISVAMHATKIHPLIYRG